MARTKQTARKSAEARPPRKQLSSSTFKPLTIVDHTGNKIAVPSRSSFREVGFFPFQVYILASAGSLSTDSDFPEMLKDYISFNDAAIRFNENCDWRLEIFSVPQSSIMDCINHHEQEKRHRKSLGKGPILLNRKELLVVDDMDWETKGLLSVEYTAQLLGRDGSEREFENHVNDYKGYQDEEGLALPGLRQDLVVQRHTHVNQLAEHFLQPVWYDEGHEWALSSLTDRNIALGWPEDPRLLEYNTLPDKPLAKQITRGYLRSEKRPRLDDECEYEDDDGDQFTNYLEWEDIITYGERCDPDTKMPKSIAHSTKPSALRSDICAPMQMVELDNVEAREVIDSVGRTCVDCSHVAHAPCETKFSYTLYVIGKRAESPQAYFASLNCKLLGSIPWTLHVYFVPDLASALSHNDDEMASRPTSGRLPINYAGPPDRPQSHVCLYVDEHMAWEAGPKIVTRDVSTTGAELEVMHAGGWDDAAQMLFTWLVVCAETPRIMASLSVDKPPAITASASLATTHPGSGECRAPEEMHLSLTLALDDAATSSITINTHNTVLTSNDLLWDQFLVIIDAETNEEIILPPSPSYPWNTPHVLSVEQLQGLSFPFSATSPVQHQILTLRPGEKTARTIIFKKSRLLERYQSLLVKDKRYKIVLKPGQTTQRWIWGDLEEDATGPLGMNAIPILDAGDTAQFIFEGPTEEESSFTLPHCHIDL
ncbi:hypothetical protein KCU85_g4346, partial [Aureobasidium melanogenum]